MLNVRNISYAYDGFLALNPISFSLKKGEHLSVIGASGCGKSTLLKCIYGLFDLPEGEIFWNGEKVTGPAFNLVPGNPKMKYLAQDFGLMPYISVAENVGKFLSNLDLKKKKNRIEELLYLVDMQEFSNTKALNLSGGQQQRTALAMALAQSPELLLLDEPFSQIDSFMKNPLRQKLFAMLKNQGITCITATHESAEMLGFSDWIMVMQKGKKISLDTPENTYFQQDSPYISQLFSQITVLNGKILHPEQLRIVPHSAQEATVVKSYFQGGFYLVHCQADKQSIYIKHSEKIPEGKNIFFEIVAHP